jgi:hypothetical protein
VESKKIQKKGIKDASRSSRQKRLFAPGCLRRKGPNCYFDD